MAIQARDSAAAGLLDIGHSQAVAELLGKTPIAQADPVADREKLPIAPHHKKRRVVELERPAHRLTIEDPEPGVALLELARASFPDLSSSELKRRVLAAAAVLLQMTLHLSSSSHDIAHGRVDVRCCIYNVSDIGSRWVVLCDVTQVQLHLHTDPTAMPVAPSGPASSSPPRFGPRPSRTIQMATALHS